MRKLLLLLAATALLPGAFSTANAQTSQPSPSPLPSATPAASAKPGDVDSIDHIIAAVYDVISGPAGPRDWSRFNSLFYAGARLIPTRTDDKGAATARVLTPEEYAARGRDFFSKEGFFENSIANRVESWTSIAHVWSTYESRHAKGEKPFARGINSFQLFHDGSRWWILSIFWQSEDAAHPLPEKYLK